MAVRKGLGRGLDLLIPKDEGITVTPEAAARFNLEKK